MSSPIIILFNVKWEKCIKNVLSTNVLNVISSVPHPKEERRRATHNEVERRRRDNINTGIHRLGKLIPHDVITGDEVNKATTTTKSKGDILAKACEYLAELRRSNQRLGETGIRKKVK